MQTASSESDCYDNISVLSTYWESDDTGSKEDTTLFLDTISKLENVETHKRVLADDDEVFSLRDEIANQAKSTIAGNRQLFILHYVGHAVATSTSSRLVITPKIAHGEFVGPQLNMTLVKDALKDLATTSPGLDILLVMGCLTSLAESTRVEGARVELMAATSFEDTSKGRNESTFTEKWCTAFTKLRKTGVPFTSNDIIDSVNSHSGPSGFILREGWGLPIAFCALPGLDESTIAARNSQSVLITIRIMESPDSDSVERLIDYLQNGVVPIEVLATLPISGIDSEGGFIRVQLFPHS